MTYTFYSKANRKVYLIYSKDIYLYYDKEHYCYSIYSITTNRLLSTLPKTKPTITPILPNLLKIPAIIPDIAYAAIIIGSVPAIVPKVTPIVTPEVVPTNIPFFQPSIITINILNIFLIPNPYIFRSPRAASEMDKIKLAPITSSIEKARFLRKSCKTVTEFTNIL